MAKRKRKATPPRVSIRNTQAELGVTQKQLEAGLKISQSLTTQFVRTAFDFFQEVLYYEEHESLDDMLKKGSWVEMLENEDWSDEAKITFDKTISAYIKGTLFRRYYSLDIFGLVIDYE